MKKIALMALFAAAVMSVNATDLWTGSKHVSWDDGGVDIAATQFTDATAGQKIVVTYTGASDGIEFKLLDVWDHLAGSREAAWISGDGTYEQFLTPAAVAGLKAHGLQVIGANFTCTKVELLDGKAALKDGYTVWTGYFWADDWKTLELYRESYAGVDFSKVQAVRFYSEAASGAYVLNLKESWEGDGHIADQTAMTDGEGYKELPLTDALRTRLANAGHWMIQFNKEEISAFNVTDVVLVMAPDPDYYLVGSMNGWAVDSAYLFVANPANEGEYMLDVTLTQDDQLKVIGTADGGLNKTWYPDGLDNNYVVDAAHAGKVTVYFRPEGNVEGWYYGYFYVTEASGQGFNSINAASKTVKLVENGQIVILKNGVKYNALGTEIK